MKRIAIAAATAVAIAVAGPAATAQADSQGICTWEATLEQSYGLTLTPHESTFHTPEPGSITCTGTVEGRELDGTGWITFTGATSDTWCGAGTGYVDVTAVIPDTSGRKFKLRTRSNWSRVGLTGVISGAFRDGSPYRGPFEAQPLDGDCHSEPVRHVTLRSQLVF